CRVALPGGASVGRGRRCRSVRAWTRCAGWSRPPHRPGPRRRRCASASRPWPIHRPRPCSSASPAGRSWRATGRPGALMTSSAPAISSGSTGSRARRLRRATGITTLSPLHRLDRRTAGVLVFGIRPEERSAYQQLFARGEVDKEYLARVRPGDDTGIPLMVRARAVLRDRLHKERGHLTTSVVEGVPNALTDLEVLARERDGTT